MSDFKHREAVGAGKRLRLGVGGPSRSGKTYSSLRVATGMQRVLGGVIFLVDTDNEFALDYAEDFKFQHVDFQPPFTSERYQEAIEYCVKQRASIIVVDHMTHEQTGPGGILERKEAVAQRLSKAWGVSVDKASAAAWNEAKTVPHGKFVSYVTRVKQPIIFNFRAKDKIKIDQKGGKQEWIHMGYQPICAEQFDYEMTAMLILGPNSDGKPDREQSEIRKPLRGIITLEDTMDEALGERLARWTLGTAKATSPGNPSAASATAPAAAAAASGDVAPLIVPTQVEELLRLLAERKLDVARLCDVGKIATLDKMRADRFGAAKKWIEGHPKAVMDEAATLLKMDGATTREAATEILDTTRAEPWHAKAVEAFTNRWDKL